MRYGVVLAILAVVVALGLLADRALGCLVASGCQHVAGSQDAATDKASALSGPSHTVALRPRAGEYVVQLPAVSGPC